MAGKNVTIANKKYNVISKGANGTCVEFSRTECSKIFELGEAKKESELMKSANSINNLVCKYIRTEYSDDYSAEFLVMERLYPLQYRSLTLKEREDMFDTFLNQVKELHTNGFAHRDIKRPAHIASGERSWDNIVLTAEGLRLIDTGNSVTSDNYDFEDACIDDIACVLEFKAVFLIP